MTGSRHVRELNRVLSVVADLRLVTDCVLMPSVIQSCRQSIFFGGFVDQQGVLSMAIDAGLVLVYHEECLRLSPVGERFLELNPERFYELQADQATYLFDVLFRAGPLRAPAADLAKLLEIEPDTGVAFLTRRALRDAPNDLRSCFDILRLLSVFSDAEAVWTVAPGYVQALRELRRVGTTSAELMEILEHKAAFGRAAELLCVEFERNRLRGLNAHAQAERVNRISEWDVGAGFDIESFHDGDSSSADRFIEVKSYAGKGLRFYWTRNEYVTAKKLSTDYFIYYFERFSPREGLAKIKPTVLRDPAKMLPALPTVTMEPQVVLVTDSPSGTGLSFEPVFEPPFGPRGDFFGSLL